MPLQSDLTLDASKFGFGAISEQTHKFNEQMMKLDEAGPKWWTVGAEKYRQMRWNGETPMPKPRVLDSGKNIVLPSRQSGRNIPCRVFYPEGNKPRGVFYHIHGGGWVLQSEASQDLLLKHYADHGNLVVVSVGYRLAPEHPYPAGNEDCVDIGEYLIDNAERDYGVPLKFMGGDSAGAHLSVVMCYSFLRTRPRFAFKGLVLNFGCYDLTAFLPQAHTFKLPLILSVETMQHFISLPFVSLDNLRRFFHYTAAYLPNFTIEQRRDPMISPIYAEMSRMKLPPALFTCGTSDCLLDDSLLMHTKWAASGAQSILKIYPGGAHGFVAFPVGGTEQTKASLDDICTFIDERA